MADEGTCDQLARLAGVDVLPLQLFFYRVHSVSDSGCVQFDLYHIDFPRQRQPEPPCVPGTCICEDMSWVFRVQPAHSRTRP